MKVPLLFCAFLATFASGVRADDIKRIALDGKTSVPAPVQEDGKDGIARIHKVDSPALELFPTSKKPSHGTILISPGGGYSILAVTHEGRDVAKMLNDDGWDAAVLLYRVNEGPKTRELAMEDGTAAVNLLQKQGRELGLSTERIGLMGFSAGGHLTARLAHEFAGSKAVQFVVLMYAAYLEKDGKVLEDVQPGKLPVFLYVAGDDKLSPSSKVYAEAAKAAGATAELHIPEKGGHGFGLKEGMPESVRDWPEKLRGFLAQIAQNHSTP